MQIHVVQQGENLWLISQRYGVNMNQIASANQLDNPNILVFGQALVIPAPYQTYVVQPGDTLTAIARRYGTTIEAITEANQIIDPSVIYIGQVLSIPVIFHTVKQGETLWLIARNYGTTVDAIAQLNQISNPSLIYPGLVLRIPERSRPVIEVNAYTTKASESGRQEVLNLGRYFTYLTPFTYAMKEDGTITTRNEEAVLEAARAKHVVPLLVLTNFSGNKFDSDLAAAILRNPTLQETLITNILNTIREKGYIGLNLDLEYVYPEDRENYNAFLRRVVARLRPLGLSVSTALAPKISADQKGLLYEAHDYKAQGEIVDFIVLMTYEWGWAGGRPWAIAPINEVRRVLDYAVTVIPPNKILMGYPLYGRDWKIPWAQGTFAKTVSPQEAIRLAAKYGVAIQYNQTYQSPFFRYTDENGQQHEVWFEDARSAQAKFDTVKIYGLRGVSYWVLGSPFPQNWLMQEWNFRARKLI
ncbi:LysM peptidoglycan-binding domain-containing protein [Bacillus sp. DTU_2020_1000418_1_SI_GHA_SEK_038]|uniref:LysM peptidoglycan-binding domain-containing protein n=1 Tax=Bacillus sp. DTU_2020_1000418_1_SI_GHA_SEK_038 TaxID=3077585 RepID=UPI0028E699C5|nr:LysM peptidoglycan-binding domain-containing protein [Bacillus sp. DTU_2020_1000418_1_SI_GHA_SEK_038]WNS76676.1 LysM peptidoglycan-binding domain-containing protein [Bacillus sp. DTU_2020_1000418_1_SI_GHA_SEK_038]